MHRFWGVATGGGGGGSWPPSQIQRTVFAGKREHNSMQYVVSSMSWWCSIPGARIPSKKIWLRGYACVISAWINNWNRWQLALHCHLRPPFRQSFSRLFITSTASRTADPQQHPTNFQHSRAMRSWIIVIRILGSVRFCGGLPPGIFFLEVSSPSPNRTRFGDDRPVVVAQPVFFKFQIRSSFRNSTAT